MKPWSTYDTNRQTYDTGKSCPNCSSPYVLLCNASQHQVDIVHFLVNLFNLKTGNMMWSMIIMIIMTKKKHWWWKKNLFEFQPVGVIKLAWPGFPRGKWGKTTPVVRAVITIVIFIVIILWYLIILLMYLQDLLACCWCIMVILIVIIIAINVLGRYFCWWKIVNFIVIMIIVAHVLGNPAPCPAAGAVITIVITIVIFIVIITANVLGRSYCEQLSTSL